MALNYYEGWTVAELLAERRRVQEAISSGQLSGWRDGDGSAERQFSLKPDTILERIAYSLYLLDSETYPYDNRRVYRTTPRYTTT